MRTVFLVLGMLVVLGLVALANDGSVPWPQEASSEGSDALVAPATGPWSIADDGSVPYPVDAEATSILCPIWAVALCCLISGCEYYPGTFLGCWCTAEGWVACMYYRCFDLWYPPCCYCGHEIVYPGIPCTPGDPVPQWRAAGTQRL